MHPICVHSCLKRGAFRHGGRIWVRASPPRGESGMRGSLLVHLVLLFKTSHIVETHEMIIIMRVLPPPPNVGQLFQINPYFLPVDSLFSSRFAL